MGQDQHDAKWASSDKKVMGSMREYHATGHELYYPSRALCKHGLGSGSRGQSAETLHVSTSLCYRAALTAEYMLQT